MAMVSKRKNKAYKVVAHIYCDQLTLVLQDSGYLQTGTLANSSDPWLRNKKNNFQLICTLIFRPDLLIKKTNSLIVCGMQPVIT